MRTLLASIVFSLLAMAPALAAIDAVQVRDPRGYGYFLGDTIERTVEVTTSGSTELIVGALPRPGPVTYWLDLVSAEMKVHERGGEKVSNLTLKYQIFYSALEPKKLEIPAIPLKFRDASAPKTEEGDEQSASIPAMSIIVSPLREIMVGDVSADKEIDFAEVLRPDASARTIGVRALEWRVGIALAALAASIIGLLWHYAMWPFNRRAGRPFAAASRQLARLDTAASHPADYGQSLLILHRAFDDAYGRRLFASDVGRFVEKQQRFAGLSGRLSSFFENSRLYFFSDDKSAAEKNFPIEDVVRLAADLAREERAAA